MRKLAKLGLCGGAAFALCAAAITPAFADPNPVGSSSSSSPGDVVAVGSDTLQFADDFIADGVGTNNGYNFFHPTQRYVSFDAVNPYTQTGGDLIRLRAIGGGTDGLGTNPGTATGTNVIPRINGSTEGKQAILPGTGCGSRSGSDGYPAAPLTRVDVARSSSALSATQDTASCLQQTPFATDTIQVAVRNAADGGTSIPAGGLTTAQLQGLYEPNSCAGANVGTTGCPVAPLRTLGDLGVTTNGTADPTLVFPILPQAGSGTRNSFLNDLYGSTGQNLTSFTPNLVLRGGTVFPEEHNPDPFINPQNYSTSGGTAINPLTEISPFSGGRASLVAAGYFNFLNASNATAQTTYSNSITLLPGTGTGAAQVYQNTRNLYHDVRGAQETSATPPAWIASLLGPSGFFCSSSAGPILSAAGVTQLTSGCGTFS